MAVTVETPTPSLEEFLAHPLDRVEWVDQQLLSKHDMTAKTGRIQARLAYHWRNHLILNDIGGEIYTETACRTVGRVRCPDVAYLLPEQVAEYGDFKILPHSFPLIAEVISPTDEAEEVFTKVREYLESQAQEIWLIFPDSRWVMTITATQQRLWQEPEEILTQSVLPGFKLKVAELIA